MIKKRTRDWFRIIRDLMKAGVSMGKIAKACGKSCTRVVAHWAEGGEPKDSDARVVLALYRRYCPEEYRAHMAEFEPEAMEYVERVFVKADNAIRGRPKPRRVAVVPSGQFDFFATEAA